MISKDIKYVTEYVINTGIVLVFLFLWIAGIVLAKGFSLIYVSIICPPYGWYLVVEKILQMWGWV